MEVYRGKKFRLIVEERELPNGKRRKVEKVVHPGSAVILPLIDKEEILMIRQYRPVIGEWLYELPAGTVDPGESPMETARRELEEETGYVSGSLREVLQFYPSPGITDELMHLFLAKDLNKKEQRLEEYEIIEVCKLQLSEAIGMVEQNRIRDAKTAISLLYYANFLR